MNVLRSLFNEIYSESTPSQFQHFEQFLSQLQQLHSDYLKTFMPIQSDWYKDAVIYSMYVDLFNHNFDGLTDKLDYLQELGVTCLWLLPILESPMKDAGFDISNYESIRADLLGLDSSSTLQERDLHFSHFIHAAKEKNIRIIFDIAMNHCSVEHPWFQEAILSKDSKYRDYFIWSDDTTKYHEARIIFKGICESNWEYEPQTQQYFFHRFFEIQPDLNYKNPNVLLEMSLVLAHWKLKGIDGFRADAVPYIWKEEGTNCENLTKTHLVVKFFRAVLDYISPGSLLLAEACQPPEEVVAYFGEGDECHAAYHFPVMPRIYKALAEELSHSIQNSLDPLFTPSIPKSCQWFMFLRCHDELTLEMVTPEERSFIYTHYAKKPLWDFRLGEGISSRLAELFDFDLNKILLANSISFTLVGTPIIYYGDEFGKSNDEAFYYKTAEESGYADSRYLARGPIDWDEVTNVLQDPSSLGYALYHTLSKMIRVRKEHLAFSRGSLSFVESTIKNDHILSYVREYQNNKVLILENLSMTDQYFSNDAYTSAIIRSNSAITDLLGQEILVEQEHILLHGSSFYWIETTR